MYIDIIETDITCIMYKLEKTYRYKNIEVYQNKIIPPILCDGKKAYKQTNQQTICL